MIDKQKWVFVKKKKKKNTYWTITTWTKLYWDRQLWLLFITI